MLRPSWVQWLGKGYRIDLVFPCLGSDSSVLASPSPVLRMHTGVGMQRALFLLLGLSSSLLLCLLSAVARSASMGFLLI